jgi:hypothetical protein
MKTGDKNKKNGDTGNLKQQLEKGIDHLMELHKVQSSLIFDLKRKISLLKAEKHQ